MGAGAGGWPTAACEAGVAASGGARSAGGNWLLPPPLRGLLRLGEGRRPARPRAQVTSPADGRAGRTGPGAGRAALRQVWLGSACPCGRGAGGARAGRAWAPGRRAGLRAVGWAAARGARSGGGIGRERPCRSGRPRRRPDVPCSRAPRDPPRALPRRLLTLGGVTCYGDEVRESPAEWRRVRPLSRGTSRSARRAILFNALSWSKGNLGPPAHTRAITRDTGRGAESCW